MKKVTPTLFDIETPEPQPLDLLEHDSPVPANGPVIAPYLIGVLQVTAGVQKLPLSLLKGRLQVSKEGLRNDGAEGQDIPQQTRDQFIANAVS